VPLLRNLLRNPACAAALPYNGLFQWFPGRLIPDRRRLTLMLTPIPAIVSGATPDSATSVFTV